MDLHIQVVFKEMKQQALANTLEKVVNFMKAIEYKIKCTDKEKCAGKMAEYMKVFRINYKKYFININKIIFFYKNLIIQENISGIKRMEKELIYGVMDVKFKENGNMVKCMEIVY